MERMIANDQKKMKKKSGKNHANVVFRVIALVVLIAYTLFLFFLLGWGFLASFKSDLDFIIYPSKLFPSGEFGGFQFVNYVKAFKGMKVPMDRATSDGYVYADRMLLYSMYWAVGSAFLNTFTTMLVAYCCALFRKKLFSRIIYVGTVFAISLPLIGTMPAQIKLVTELGLYNNPLLMPAMKISFISTYFLVFYAIFLDVPEAYREAAQIDGAGHWTILFKISMPMVKNTFLSVFILFFIQYWNDYSVPMMFLPNYPTLAQGLYELMNGQASRDPEMHTGVSLAAALMVAMPPLILFVAFRSKIMENIAIGGIKG